MRASRSPGTVVMTGATRGTGKAIATALRDRGTEIISVGRYPAPVQGVRHVECDLKDTSSVQRAGARIQANTPEIRALVLSAAHRSFRTIDDRQAEWQSALAVNLLSAVTLLQALMESLRCAHGRVVVMGSHAARRFFEGGASYSATKAALSALVETLLLEERAHGITATYVDAGAIANEAGDESPWKMSTEAVARVIEYLTLDVPDDIAVGSIELRPARLDSDGMYGIERLQRV